MKMRGEISGRIVSSIYKSQSWNDFIIHNLDANEQSYA